MNASNYQVNSYKNLFSKTIDKRYDFDLLKSLEEWELRERFKEKSITIMIVNGWLWLKNHPKNNQAI